MRTLTVIALIMCMIVLAASTLTDEATRRKARGNKDSDRPGPDLLALNDRSLLKNYRGKEEIPEALYETYAKLVKAMKDGNIAEIRGYCLPHAVRITREPRPEKME